MSHVTIWHAHFQLSDIQVLWSWHHRLCMWALLSVIIGLAVAALHLQPSACLGANTLPIHRQGENPALHVTFVATVHIKFVHVLVLQFVLIAPVNIPPSQKNAQYRPIWKRSPIWKSAPKGNCNFMKSGRNIGITNPNWRNQPTPGLLLCTQNSWYELAHKQIRY
jgi:hypothetical protein